MDRLSDVLTAISHPTRRAIIGQLANGPARFLDIAKPYDTALNAVTKHLKMLERAGLIKGEWKETENSRRAKYYALTEQGQKRLSSETREWGKQVAAIARILEAS